MTEPWIVIGKFEIFYWVWTLVYRFILPWINLYVASPDHVPQESNILKTEFTILLFYVNGVRSVSQRLSIGALKVMQKC